MKTRILKSALMWLPLESELLRLRRNFGPNSFNLLTWQIGYLRLNVSPQGAQLLGSPATAQVSRLFVQWYNNFPTALLSSSL